MYSFSMDPRRPIISSSPSTSSSSSFSLGQGKDFQSVMSTFSLRPTNAEKKKPLDINSLMSPPEPTPFDNFQQSVSIATMQATPTRAATATVAEKQEKRPPTSLMMSPPISPATKDGNAIEIVPTNNGESKDPILFPSPRGRLSPSPQQPLFTQASSIQRRVIDEHVAAREPTMFQRTPPPSTDQYDLALYFRSSMMQHYERDPKGWLRKQREQNLADSKARAEREQRNGHSAPRRPLPLLQPSRIISKTAAPRVTKPERPTKRVIRAAPAVQSTYITVAPGDRKRTPPRHRIPSATPEPRRTAVPNREDKDFLALQDYCPPLETLAQQNQHLKVDWKGNALDLSDDPHRHLLHPEELTLASGLRLDCATYLTSKRRIFERRLECAVKNPPKEFRKTDAQQACKIDVNKASKLWQAYEKVGWLHPKHMAKFIARN